MWDYIYNLLPNLGRLLHDVLSRFLPDWAVYIAVGLIDIAVIITLITLALLGVIYIERRVVGRFQMRMGPNRVGPFGLLQPVADALKVLTKETIIPERADPWIHLLAPVAVTVPALLIFAVLPFAEGAILADLNIGILYIIAVGTLSIIGVFMAGWGSNNKYALLGAMRSVAQLVSYEVPMVLSVIGVVMVAETLSMSGLARAQTVPFLLLQPLGFLVYFIGAVAELNRSPMDIMEAESEIVAGYHIEYSGMKFSLFYLAEYINALAVSAIVATLFLGGWKGPLLPPYLWFLIKLFAVLFVLIWLRSTLPRLRVDQLMAFAWKFLFPMALLNVFITGFELLLLPDFPGYLALVNIPLAALIVVVWSNLFGAPALREAPSRTVRVV